MKNTRVYNVNIDIDGNKVRQSFDERASNIENMDCIFTSVLLGDQDPSYAESTDREEKKKMLPKLGINSSTIVLDMGCGIGRWGGNINYLQTILRN